MTALDQVIREFVSYDLYKRGKAPIARIDPGQRIRKGIWRDQGMDLVSLLGSEPDADDPLMRTVRTERVQVKMGFLRGRRLRPLVKGLEDPSKVIAMAIEDRSLAEIALSSNLLMPPFMVAITEPLIRSVHGLALRETPRSDPGDLWPEGREANKGEEKGRYDVLRLFERKVPAEHRLVLPNGMRATSLKVTLKAILEMGDAEFGMLVQDGSLAAFARDGLQSPSLEAILSEIGRTPAGGPEAPERSRERFGLWLMDGPLGPACYSEVIEPMLRRLSNCGKGEAEKLERSMETVMDERSAPVLIELLFTVPPENRTAVITLLGMTRSDAAIDPLKRIRDHSALGTDRSAAAAALERLGAR